MNKVLKKAGEGFDLIRFIIYYIMIVPFITLILSPFILLGLIKDLITKCWDDWTTNRPLGD